MGQQSRLSTDSHSAQVERLRSTPSNVESLPKFDPNRNSMTSAPHAFTIVNHRGSSQPKMAFFYLRVVASSANLRDFYGLIPHGRAVHRSYGNTSTFERDNYDCIIY